jgi:ATP-binding cassette subfamily C protein CydD
MSTIVAPRPGIAALKMLLPDGRAAASILVADAVAAIGFALGLAGAVAKAGGVSAVMPWLGLALAAGVVRGGLMMIAAGSGARDGARMTGVARRQVLRSAMRATPGTGTTSVDLVTAVVDAVDALDGYAARFLPARRAAAITPLLVLAAIACASPVGAAILVATLVPFVAAMILAGGAAADRSRRQFVAMARLSALFADRIRALPVVLAFRAEEREAQRIGTASEELATRTMGVLRVAFLSSGALEFFAALSVALVAVYCGFALLGLLPFPAPERLDIAHAFFVLALAPEFYAPMRRLAAAYHERQAAETAADRLAPMLVDHARPAEVRVASPPRIVFADVAIRYAESDRDAVHLSLSVAPGEIVALVGPSGSGKTSVLRALLGLAPVRHGEICIDGIPLAPGSGLGSVAAWAGQDPLILPGTIREAIALGDPQAGEDRIVAAATRAGLDPMLARRQGGLDARLDTRGGGLSGGERRRIGIARALLKDAPLLLLDEPTAHLDAAAEAATIAVLARACAGRTAIIATHSARLAAIADHVVILGIRP